MNDTRHRTRHLLIRAITPAQMDSDTAEFHMIYDLATDVVAQCDENTVLRLASLISMTRPTGTTDEVRAGFDERHQTPVPEYHATKDTDATAPLAGRELW